MGAVGGKVSVCAQQANRCTTHQLQSQYDNRQARTHARNRRSRGRGVAGAPAAVTIKLALEVIALERLVKEPVVAVQATARVGTARVARRRGCGDRSRRAGGGRGRRGRRSRSRGRGRGANLGGCGRDALLSRAVVVAVPHYSRVRPTLDGRAAVAAVGQRPEVLGGIPAVAFGVLRLCTKAHAHVQHSHHSVPTLRTYLLLAC